MISTPKWLVINPTTEISYHIRRILESQLEVSCAGRVIDFDFLCNSSLGKYGGDHEKYIASKSNILSDPYYSFEYWWFGDISVFLKVKSMRSHCSLMPFLALLRPHAPLPHLTHFPWKGAESCAIFIAVCTAVNDLYNIFRFGMTAGNVFIGYMFWFYTNYTKFSTRFQFPPTFLSQLKGYINSLSCSRPSFFISC